MATIACYSHGRTEYTEESSFNVLTPDDVFDILEDMIDEVKAVAKRYAPLKVRDGFNADFADAKVCGEYFDEMWDKLSKDTAESYYINSRVYTDLDKYDTAIDAAYVFIRCLLCKGTMETVRFRYTTAPYMFVMEKYVVDTQDCYMQFRRAPDNKTCQVFDMDSYNKCAASIKYLNKRCRVFECKECGRLSYVDKATDDIRRERGLPVYDKCFHCATGKDS